MLAGSGAWGSSVVSLLFASPHNSRSSLPEPEGSRSSLPPSPTQGHLWAQSKGLMDEKQTNEVVQSCIRERELGTRWQLLFSPSVIVTKKYFESHPAPCRALLRGF